MIDDRAAGELAKMLFAAGSGMTRGGQIYLVGPSIPESTRTDMTIGAASRGVISAAMGPAKRQKTIGLHHGVHEASSGKGSAHPRGKPMALAVTGRLGSRSS